MLSENEIQDLERRWKRYRKNRVKRVFLCLFCILIVLIIALIYKYDNLHLAKYIQKGSAYTRDVILEKNSIKHIKKVVNNKDKTTDNNISFVKEKERKMLRLDISFQKHIYDRIDIKDKKNILKKSNNRKDFQKAKADISISSSKIDILKYLQDRFKKTHSAKYAVMISKELYKRKKYKSSLSWAIIANDVDSLNEESWIMFAKNSIKLGKKVDAINALRAYLKIDYSKRVDELLSNIYNGDIK